MELQRTPEIGLASTNPSNDPESVIVVIFVRSYGGAQCAIMAYIAGNVTPCRCRLEKQITDLINIYLCDLGLGVLVATVGIIKERKSLKTELRYIFEATFFILRVVVSKKKSTFWRSYIQ